MNEWINELKIKWIIKNWINEGINKSYTVLWTKVEVLFTWYISGIATSFFHRNSKWFAFSTHY